MGLARSRQEHLVGRGEQQALEVVRAGRLVLRPHGGQCVVERGRLHEREGPQDPGPDLAQPQALGDDQLDRRRRQRSLLEAVDDRAHVLRGVQAVVDPRLERTRAPELDVVLEHPRVGHHAARDEDRGDLGVARPVGDDDGHRRAGRAGRVHLTGHPPCGRGQQRHEHHHDPGGHRCGAPQQPALGRQVDDRLVDLLGRLGLLGRGCVGVGVGHAGCSLGGRDQVEGSVGRGRPSSQDCSMTAAAAWSTTWRRARPFLFCALRCRSAVTVVKRSS